MKEETERMKNREVEKGSGTREGGMERRKHRQTNRLNLKTGWAARGGTCGGRAGGAGAWVTGDLLVHSGKFSPK